MVLLKYSNSFDLLETYSTSSSVVLFLFSEQSSSEHYHDNASFTHHYFMMLLPRIEYASKKLVRHMKVILELLYCLAHIL
jgi:hypothetical protein